MNTSTCVKCGKSLSEPSGGIYTGAMLATSILGSSYPCKSCGSVFCIDCMAQLKKGNRICPQCGQDIGW